jgi:cyclopropane-fatty-acyl-phospholipid synthase
MRRLSAYIASPPRSDILGADHSQRALAEATQKIDAILSLKEITARIILGTETITVGNKRNEPGRSVGLVFRSSAEAKRTLAKLRLVDFARAYIDGNLEVDGNVRDAVLVLDALSKSNDLKQGSYEKAWRAGLRAIREIIPQIGWNFESLGHYRQSASAYELFLDEWMQYTCGRFVTGTETISEAQAAKFVFIKELATNVFGDIRGARHLDIGCGWGGMLSYFERQFGTRSTGVTNTRQQAEYARRRYGADVKIGDFRVLASLKERFDIVTIVGMMEHLSPHRRDELLRIVHGVLSDRGVVYLQCIGKPECWIGGDAYRVAQDIVFPGHYVESWRETKKRIAAAGFEVLATFEHGSDYALTTARWVDAIQNNIVNITEFVGARQSRIFLGYLAYASMLFSSGRGSLVRYLFKKSDRDRIRSP